MQTQWVLDQVLDLVREFLKIIPIQRSRYKTHNRQTSWSHPVIMANSLSHRYITRTLQQNFVLMTRSGIKSFKKTSKNLKMTKLRQRSKSFRRQKKFKRNSSSRFRKLITEKSKRKSSSRIILIKLVKMPRMFTISTKIRRISKRLKWKEDPGNKHKT